MAKKNLIGCRFGARSGGGGERRGWRSLLFLRAEVALIQRYFPESMDIHLGCLVRKHTTCDDDDKKGMSKKAQPCFPEEGCIPGIKTSMVYGAQRAKFKPPSSPEITMEEGRASRKSAIQASFSAGDGAHIRMTRREWVRSPAEWPSPEDKEVTAGDKTGEAS